jgi:hypothetical protein
MQPVWFDLALVNEKEGRSIRARIEMPVPEFTHPVGSLDPVQDWRSEVVIEVDGQNFRKKVWSANWPGALLLALEYIHSFIPPDQEREWVDPHGLESWCIFPKVIPIGWGYPLYSRISKVCEELEREYTDDVQRRRIESEKRRGSADD